MRIASSALAALALAVVATWVATSRKPLVAAFIAISAVLTILFISRWHLAGQKRRRQTVHTSKRTTQTTSKRTAHTTSKSQRLPPSLLVSGTRPVGGPLPTSAPLPISALMEAPRAPVHTAPLPTNATSLNAPARIVDLTAPGPGEILGRYQLLTSVGQGGMGRVWAARQIGSRLERLVAVKTTLCTEDEPTDVRSVFLNEARIASLIRHPNVCGVYELGDQAGVLYQVMEWCDGASLRQVLDGLPNRRMDLPVAVLLTMKVSAGLHAAHQLEDDDATAMHVVHRDVSPHNILISRNGQVKVTDFGVAKARGQLQNPSAMGELAGKLSYMAPEQIAQTEIDHRADIFALGCILYEATVGRSAFDGPAAAVRAGGLAARTLTAPRAIAADYPKDLEAIVMKALAQDAKARYQSAEELGVALGGWLARARGVVTEQAIAELMASATGKLIDDKARRIQEAMKRFPAPIPLIETGTGLAPAPGTIERPTLPAGPAARKTRQSAI